MHGYADQIQLAITGPMVGHVQIHAPEWREERAMDLTIPEVEKTLEAIEANSEVLDAAARVYSPVLVAPGEDAYTAVVVGVDIESESAPQGLLSGMKGPLASKGVLIGHILARKLNAEPGQELAVIGQTVDGSIADDLFVVQSVIRSSSSMINESGVIMSLADAQELLALYDEAHEIIIWNTASGLSQAVVDRLNSLAGFSDLEVLTWKEVVPELAEIIDIAVVAGYIMVVFVLVAAAAGVANTMMMATFERMHELGMLLALGSRPNRITFMIVIEALLLGILGVVIGTVFGYLFVFITSHSGIDMAAMADESVNDFAFMGLNLPLLVYPRLEFFDALVGLLAVSVISLVASVWPALMAARLEPVEAMRS
jgi:ABC-type lipoprotein release transport system permease subunit